MRLINADALKAEIEKTLDNADLSEYEACICVTSIYDKAIDNAPTVETFTKDDMAGAYNEGYACGSRETERPQGEWKLDSLGAYCSECGTHPDYSSNYCPNCGADMKGGAE